MRLWKRLEEGVLAAAATLTARAVSAQTDYGFGDTFQGPEAGQFVYRLGNQVITVLLIVSVALGGFLVVSGIMAYANREMNPQGGSAGMKKVVAGALLLAVSVVLGVLRSTIKSAGAGGSWW